MPTVPPYGNWEWLSLITHSLLCLISEFIRKSSTVYEWFEFNYKALFNLETPVLEHGLLKMKMHI